MKKRLFIVFLPVLLALCLFGCKKNTDTALDDNRINIVATIFPAYDWTKNIIGENPANIQLSLLLDNGVDLHSYQPSVQDIQKISTCDLFIYVGGESDEWIEDVLSTAKNKDMKVICLMDILGSDAKNEETVEGMQSEEEALEDEAEYDEHVWLSLKNAGLFTTEIIDTIASMDPDNADIYKKNGTYYIEKLDELDKEYEKKVSSADKKVLLFGDRFPFRYLTEDYNLDYYAAFLGCSAETEASFETITFLSGKVDELSLNAVLTIEGSDQKIAKTIIDNTSEKDQKLLVLDSMQSTTKEDIASGTTYISIMESNLSVIEEALN